MDPSPRHIRTLVTGGAGFVGSHLVDFLLARGDDVTVVDNLTTGRRENLPASHDRLTFIHAGVTGALPQLADMPAFDEVYHLAAAVGVKLVVDEPITSIETNIRDTADLLRFCAARRPMPRFLLTSSSEVYGKGLHETFSEEDDVVFGPTSRSRWSYGCSKAIDEFLALAYHEKHGVPAVVVRLFNTVGPRQVGDYGMVLPNFVRLALAGEPLTIFGDGQQSRCFCDVRDVASALPRLLAEPACRGRVFNLGSDRLITIDELADTVIDELGSPSNKVHIPYERAYSAGFEDLRRRRPDLARVRSAIGFAPRIDLRQTIRDIAETFRASNAASLA